MFSVPTVLALGGNAFGIRWRQGRVYASAFEATQPYGTARLAGLKVLVQVGLRAGRARRGRRERMGIRCHSSRSAADRLAVPLSSWQRAIEGAVGALTGYEQLALAVVASIGVALMVASLAAFAALRARYPRRLNIAGWLLLLYGLVLVLLALAGQRGIGLEFLLDALFGATRWIAAPAIVLATVYLFWRAFAERLLTLRSGVWRRPGLGGIRGGMGDGAACGRRAARRDARDGCRLDAVAGAAAADGQRPGALVAQPHSPSVTEPE